MRLCDSFLVDGRLPFDSDNAKIMKHEGRTFQRQPLKSPCMVTFMLLCICASVIFVIFRAWTVRTVECPVQA